jgi:hypothetical protein
MSDETAIVYMRDCQASRFYTKMLTNQARLVQDLQNLSSKCVSGEQDIMRLQWFSRLICRSRDKTYPALYSEYAFKHKNRLAFLLEILRELRKAIANAAEPLQLPADLMSTLQRRLRQFDEQSLYSRACSLMSSTSPQEPQLVYDSESWW